MSAYLHREPAYEDLTDEQLEAVISLGATLTGSPGFHSVQPERTWGRGGEILIVAYFDARHEGEARKVPRSLAGLRVVVRLEDPRSGAIRPLDE